MTSEGDLFQPAAPAALAEEGRRVARCGRNNKEIASLFCGCGCVFDFVGCKHLALLIAAPWANCKPLTLFPSAGFLTRLALTRCAATIPAAAFQMEGGRV